MGSPNVENGDGDATLVTSIAGAGIAGTVAVPVGEVTVVTPPKSVLADASLTTSPASRSACVTT